MKSKLLHWFAIVLILEAGLLHIITAQGEYEHVAYMGYLFAADFFGALVAAFGIYHKQFWGWALGFFIAAGAIVAYIWSRTLGMPSMPMDVGQWFEPYGVVAKLVEVVFILLFLLRPWKIPAAELQLSTNSRLRYILPVAGLFVIAAASGFTYQWDVANTLANGHHIGSLAQVVSTPVTTFAQLEEQYGVQISLVASSMMGSIVDVRLKIIDPDKAHALLLNQVALLLNQEALILAPNMHRHGATRLKAGKIFTIFFPAQQIIHPGSNVSLVFGSVRVEPVVVR